MSTKEIITLQFGHYANFVGTHWWNIQESSFQYSNSATGGEKEEIDHDVLFREGETARGAITFTPRLVLAELKGGLGSLKSSSVLYDENEMENLMAIAWHGDVDVHEQSCEPKNQFLMDLDNDQYLEMPKMNGKTDAKSNHHKPYELEKDVKVWSDYLRTYLHPKSMMIINEYSHKSENDSFDLWTKGTNMKKTLEIIEEKIRFYAEECDQMQGFHILADSYNGFAGLTSSALQYLHDEFSSKQLITFPLFPTEFHEDSKTKSLKRNLNKALSLPIFMEHSSLVCPLSLCLESFPDITSRSIPHLIYDANLNYHTSAILASALDTATLPHRLKGNSGIYLNQFCDNITSASKNLASMSISMPFPLLSSTRTWLDQDFLTLSEFLNSHLEKDPWNLISQGFDAGCSSQSIVDEVYSQSLTLRGLPSNKLMSYSVPNCGVFSQCSTQDDLLNFYLSKRFYGCQNSVFSLSEAMNTTAPFPQFFDKRVTYNGLLTNIGSNPTFQPWQQQKADRSAIRLKHSRNGDCSGGAELTNGHTNGCDKSGFSSHVESIPVLTNIQCSSKAVNVLKSSALCLKQARTRHFSFHLMETENLETVIENLCTLQDEYKTHGQITDESDSDGDL
ncbi:protein misato homolog 1-like [Styela clava]